MNIEYERGALWEQLYGSLKDDIQNGVYGKDSRLPSRRAMAAKLGVSVNTVASAYGRLEDEGYIEARARSGYYVRGMETLIRLDIEPARPEPEKEGQYEADFSPYQVDPEGFPYALWRKLLRQSFDESDPELLLPEPPKGDAALRKAVCAYLGQSRSIDCEPGSVIVGAGTGSLLRMLCGLLPEGTIATENPVYGSANMIFRAMGRETRALDDLEALGEADARAVYVTPSHQFPLGYSLPASERVALLNWAAGGGGRYIIEDDYDSEFRYSGRPLPPIKSLDRYGRVIYIGTFSKSIAPSLKISYAVLPGELIEKFDGTYLSSVSRLEQKTLAAFINGGYFESHLNRMRSVYSRKRRLLAEIFGDCEIFGENAGHHIIVRIPGKSESELVASAERNRIKVYPISAYFMGGVPEKYSGCVMLGYGALSEKEIARSGGRLRALWL